MCAHNNIFITFYLTIVPNFLIDFWFLFSTLPFAFHHKKIYFTKYSSSDMCGILSYTSPVLSYTSAILSCMSVVLSYTSAIISYTSAVLSYVSVILSYTSAVLSYTSVTLSYVIVILKRTCVILSYIKLCCQNMHIKLIDVQSKNVNILIWFSRIIILHKWKETKKCTPI